MIHLITDYYEDGNLNEFLIKKAFFTENEIRSLLQSLMSAINECHTVLDITLTNLNMESVCMAPETEY